MGRIWEDDDFEDIMMMSSHFILMMVGAYQITSHTLPRDPAIFAQRLNWETFCSNFGFRDFKRHLRMPPEDFNLLLEYLQKPLSCNHKQSLCCGLSPILWLVGRWKLLGYPSLCWNFHPFLFWCGLRNYPCNQQL
jgi:hypothetical protein